MPNVRVNTRAPVEAFGGVPSGIDLSGVSRVAAEIWQEEQQKANQIAILDASSKLANTSTTLQVQAQQRRGKDAFELPDFLQAEWKKATDQIRQSLSNDVQRMAFDARVASEWASLNASVQRHVASERQAYDEATTQAFLATKENDAITNYQDPDRVALDVSEQTAAIRDWGRRNGAPQELIEQRIAETQSRVYAGVIGRYLDSGQDLAAKQFYEAHKDKLTGADASRVERAVQAGSILGEAQRHADAIIAQEGITRAAAFAQARQIEDPQIRQATEQQLEIEFRRRDQAEREAYEALLEEAASFVERGQRPPATIWSQFKAKDRASITRWLLEGSSPGGVRTDVVTYYDLKTKAYSDDPKKVKEFAEADLLSYRHKLSATDFKDLLNLQIRIKKGEGSIDEENATGYRTVSQMVNDALLAIGLTSSPGTGSEEAQRVAAFRRRIDEDIAAEKISKNKKELSSAEVQQIIDNALIKDVLVRRKGILGVIRSDTAAASSLLTPDERTRIGSIPDADRQAIARQIQNAGGTVTPERINRAYQAFQANNRALFLSIIGEDD